MRKNGSGGRLRRWGPIRTGAGFIWSRLRRIFIRLAGSLLRRFCLKSKIKWKTSFSFNWLTRNSPFLNKMLSSSLWDYQRKHYPHRNSCFSRSQWYSTRPIWVGKWSTSVTWKCCTLKPTVSKAKKAVSKVPNIGATFRANYANSHSDCCCVTQKVHSPATIAPKSNSNTKSNFN